jgi:hypothetical protein
MDPLSTLALAAITDGVKFLYAQAGEFLSAWRSRRQDTSAPPPRVLKIPAGVAVTRPRPLPDPPSEQTVGLLEELQRLVEPIQSGQIDATTPAARATIEQLRDVIEALLQTQIRLAGEPPRPLKISDINVVTHQVAGRVSGLRANLAKLPGGSEISDVHVQTGDVEAGGEVTAVDLT